MQTERDASMVGRNVQRQSCLKSLIACVLAIGLVALTGASSSLLASHATHFVSPKGPLLPLDEDGCYTCHANGNRQCEESPVFADNEFLADTSVCDACHSPRGALDGVQMAKANWEGGIYEADGTTVKSGKEQWCAACHDIEPANSKADGSGIDAPKVGGDNSTWGFYATGHGAHGFVECLECHDAGKTHIDHEHRTYASVYNNYQVGYRLAKGLVVPRPHRGSPPNVYANLDDFALCGDCHNLYEVLGEDIGEYDASHTNFYAYTPKGNIRNSHKYHLNMTGLHFDSDWDWAVVESTQTCITCHNVHGPPNQAMIRHGELMSTYGTADKVPGMDFCYLTSFPHGCSTVATLNESDGSRIAWEK